MKLNRIQNVDMTEEPDDEDDKVAEVFGCAICGERRLDELTWIDDERVRCLSCEAVYFPGSKPPHSGPFSMN